MADAAQFEKVRSIVTSDESRRVVVVSAAGKRYKDDHKVTDLLYLCYAHLQYGVSCDGIYQMICDRYLSIRDELGLRTDLEGEFAALRRKMDQGISQDELVSRGEYFAAKLMADYLGFDFLDSTMWLKFRLDGSVDQEASYEALQHAASGRRVVMPGFYGVMPDGAIKTFTRGGSDITGALAAAALDADVYENWTDVSGFLMADPKIVPDPRPIERITYAELRELSYIGAQVLHEGTVSPVREKNIPLNIRNTNHPDEPGTVICYEAEDYESEYPITGIAGHKDFAIINVEKAMMNSEIGFGRRLLQALEEQDISFEHMPSGIDTMCVVVHESTLEGKKEKLVQRIHELCSPDTVEIHSGLALIATVGRGMVRSKGISARLFNALMKAGVNVRLIDQGSSELNIIVGVDNLDFEVATRAIYRAFVTKDNRW